MSNVFLRKKKDRHEKKGALSLIPSIGECKREEKQDTIQLKGQKEKISSVARETIY
jgi:hypothetical protein